MKKAPAGIPPEKVAWYDKLIATNPNVERKGANTPYTSHNGHMFTYLSKTGTMVLRLATAEREAFLKQYDAKLCEQYEIVQKEYVEVPDTLLENTEELQPFFEISYAYVNSLKPKTPKPEHEDDTLTSGEDEDPVPAIFEGEVIEQKADHFFEVRLDDGRVLPFCYIRGSDVGRRMDRKFIPVSGERIWIEENPYKPGHARILINKRDQPKGKTV